RVFLSGENPYRFTPAEIEGGGLTAPSSGELSSLWRLSRMSEAVQTVFERVHHREVPTIYPPAAQVVFAAATWLTPPTAPLWVHVLVLKTLLVGFDLGTLALLVALLRRVGRPASWCLAYGWCPLVLKEFANSGHLDSIAVFFTIAGALSLVLLSKGAVAGSTRRSVAQAVVAMTLLGVAVLAKSYPVILLPVVAAYLIRLLGVRAVAPLGVFVGVLAVGYAPLALPVHHVSGSGSGHPQLAGHSPWTGLMTFLTRWEMNDFLFMLVHENLRSPGAEAPPWFVIVPGNWRESLRGPFPAPFSGERGSPAFLLTEAILGAVLLLLCARWARQVYRTPEPAVLLRALFLTLAWAWLLTSAQNPWYLAWCLPFMLFAGVRSWFLLPGLVLLYYLRFWLEYHAPATEAGVRAARASFDVGIVWVEYVPFFVALLAESWCSAARARDRSTPERAALIP
ncbi:MAG: hypothetical protein L0Z62_24410, partial [Gemmataceae bacterium]|nr:hypothetical protein [Gemmataceae bacterium]